jgi:hypothetical protein
MKVGILFKKQALIYTDSGYIAVLERHTSHVAPPGTPGMHMQEGTQKQEFSILNFKLSSNPQ